MLGNKLFADIKEFIQTLLLPTPTLKDFSEFKEDAEEAYALFLKYDKKCMSKEERKRFDELQMKHLNDIIF